MPTEADWKLLARLFGDEHTEFRHRLSLFRSDAGTFYAPSAEAGSIHAQKEAILNSPGADKYLIETAEGSHAFEEFSGIAGCAPEMQAAAMDPRACNRAATLALEPDWMLLMPPDQRLVWASVCFPTRWSLVGKQLQPLADIHSVVPELNGQLGWKIDTFFGRLAAGDGWGRANWGLSTSDERNQHPDLPYTPLLHETLSEAVYLRVESQHLLKMSGTGFIAFGIRIINFPLVEVAARRPLLAGLKEQLRTMSGEVATYKGIPAGFWRRL